MLYWQAVYLGCQMPERGFASRAPLVQWINFGDFKSFNVYFFSAMPIYFCLK